MEIWKTIKDYEDYQVSNLGNVKSLKFGKERRLKQTKNSKGYFMVCLYLKGKEKRLSIHQLVGIVFLNHNPNGYNLVINHKDFNRQNNNVENLEIITARENTNKKHIKSSSSFIGVSLKKQTNKWQSQITINKKRKHLGYYNTELEAHNAYQNALLNL